MGKENLNEVDSKNNTSSAMKQILKNIILPILLLLLFSGNNILTGQVSFVATTSGFVAAGTSASTITVAHDPGTGLNRLMLVAVSTEDQDVNTVTFGGQDLDLVGSVANGTRARIFFFSMVDPPSGSANVVATLAASENRGIIMGIVSFSGVDQINPLKAFVSATANNATSTVSNVPTGPGNMVFSAVVYRDSEGSITAATGQVSRWDINTAASNTNDRIAGGGSTKAISSGTTTSMSFTQTDGGREHAIGAVSVQPVPVADLGISKSVDITEPYAGQTINFTLTATNTTGPDTARNVVVDDLLPAGFTYVSHVASGTTDYNVGGGTWNIGTLDPGSSATLAIQVIVNASGPYTNTAAISGAVLDNNGSNDTDNVTITLCQAGGTKPLFDH